MAVSPNTTCKNFCVWLQATAWLEITTPQNSIITTVYTAANAGTTVTDNVWNNFLRTTGLWYQYYTAYLAQTVNSATLPANIIQGDLIYGSAANTLSRLAKSATANSFVKNSAASNNPAWAVPATTDLSDVTAWTDYSATSTINGWSSFTTKFIQYYKIGKLVTVQFFLSGTSNSATTNFTVPFTTVNTAGTRVFMLTSAIVDNGVGFAMPGVVASAINSSVISLVRDNLNNFAAAGSKQTVGVIIIPVQ